MKSSGIAAPTNSNNNIYSIINSINIVGIPRKKVTATNRSEISSPFPNLPVHTV